MHNLSFSTFVSAMKMKMKHKNHLNSCLIFSLLRGSEYLPLHVPCGGSLLWGSEYRLAIKLSVVTFTTKVTYITDSNKNTYMLCL